MSDGGWCHHHLPHGEAQGSPALVCIVPISPSRAVNRSDLSDMYELLIKSRELKRSSSQGLQGKIVQLPTEVPLRKNPRAQQPSPSIGRCGFGEEDGSSAGESSPILLFKLKGSENPDSSEPSALTVARWRSENLSKILIATWLGFHMTFPCNVRWNLFPPRKDSGVNSQPNRTPQKNNLLKKVGAGDFLMVTSPVLSHCVLIVYSTNPFYYANVHSP